MDSFLAMNPPTDPVWAIVDCGTNTFNLLVKKAVSGEVLSNTKWPVKLGLGGLTSGKLTEEAMERGLQALREHLQTAQSFGAKRLWAFATSAVRSTENGHAFAEKVNRETGMYLNIIDGDQEALFIYEGVQQALELPDFPVLIMDIGGGSTECIIAHREKALWYSSLPLGVARLRELFSPSDPLTEPTRLALNSHILSTLQPVFDAIARFQPQWLIGSSGSFDTLFDVLAHRTNSSPLAPNQTTALFDRNGFDTLSSDLLLTTLSERLAMPGMLEMRADTLHLSPLQIQPILRKMGVHIPLHLSTFALKEGVWSSLQKNPTAWRASSL